jgi:hypothetical protein
LFRSWKHQILQLIITVYLPFHSLISTNKHSTSGTRSGLVSLLNFAAGHDPEPYPSTFDRHIFFSLRPICIAIRHAIPCFLKSSFPRDFSTNFQYAFFISIQWFSTSCGSLVSFPSYMGMGIYEAGVRIA